MEEFSNSFGSQPANGETSRSRVSAVDFSPENGDTLPEVYGDHRLVLLPRDPFWFFAYWEVSPARFAAVEKEIGRDLFDSSVWVLRVFDVLEDDLTSDKVSFFDIEIQFGARQWYVKVGRPGRAFIARLGLRLKDGRFVVILTSNRIRLPRGRVSEKTDSRWMAVGYGASDREKWNHLMEASGANEIGRGSSEIAKTMAQRWEFLRSVFSGSMSSSAMPNSGTYDLSLFLPEEVNDER